MVCSVHHLLLLIPSNKYIKIIDNKTTLTFDLFILMFIFVPHNKMCFFFRSLIKLYTHENTKKCDSVLVLNSLKILIKEFRQGVNWRNH
jgi:hypothetical protein